MNRLDVIRKRHIHTETTIGVKCNFLALVGRMLAKRQHRRSTVGHEILSGVRRVLAQSERPWAAAAAVKSCCCCWKMQSVSLACRRRMLKQCSAVTDRGTQLVHDKPLTF
jgi:hypothetical protein